MGIYKERLNFVEHDFNTSVLTFNNSEKAQGLHSVMFERDDYEHEVEAFADGTAVMSSNASTKGKIEIEFPKASPTNAYLWGIKKADAFIAISFTDSNSPTMLCSATNAKVQKAVVVQRGQKQELVKWIFVATYLDVEDGGLALVAQG